MQQDMLSRQRKNMQNIELLITDEIYVILDRSSKMCPYILTNKGVLQKKAYKL